MQQLVRERLGIQISGLAGLYCYFRLLADAWLEQDGLGVWLIPSEFMDVNYGSAVKQYLIDRVTLLHIHRFLPSDVQFDDALVSSAVVVFKKAVPRDDHAVEFSLGGSLSAPSQSQQVPMTDLRGHGKWTSFPRVGERDSASGEVTLDELFTVKRGLATGDNSFFILPRDRAAQLGIPEECLRPILPSPRFLSQTVIESDPDGYPQIERQLALIDCEYPEQEVRRRFPKFWRYLESGMANSVHAGYLASRRVPWYSQERRDPAPFLSTYMGRSRGAAGKPFRFIWNKSAAVAANVYLMLYPKPSLAKALTADPSLCDKVFAALSAIDETSLTAEGRVYGGGLYKMEPAELGRVVCPGLSKILHCQHRRTRQLQVFT
jgi:hypothetical protein